MPTLQLGNYIIKKSSKGRLSQLELSSPYQGSYHLKRFPFHSNPSYRMTRKTLLCRKRGKGHSRSTCLIRNTLSKKTSRHQLCTTSPFTTEPLVMSTLRRQQSLFVLWIQYNVVFLLSSRHSSPQPHCRVPKQQSSFLLDSASPVTALFPDSVFEVQPLPVAGDSVRLIAGIYQLPSTTIDSFRTQALLNGIYCVPLNLLKQEQNVDLERSTWIITGSNHSDLDALVSILQRQRGLVSQMIWPTAIIQMVRNIPVDVLHYRVMALPILCIFMFIAILG